MKYMYIARGPLTVKYISRGPFTVGVSMLRDRNHQEPMIPWVISRCSMPKLQALPDVCTCTIEHEAHSLMFVHVQ